MRRDIMTKRKTGDKRVDPGTITVTIPWHFAAFVVVAALVYEKLLA